MEKDLINKAVYKQMYSSVFEAFLIKNLSMDFEYAQSLWTILLSGKFKYYKEFTQYLNDPSTKKPQKCHKDLWEMMYDFAINIKSIEDYK